MKGDSENEETHADLPILAFADAPAFQAWLESRGPMAPGLWLKLAKKGAPERTLASRRPLTLRFAMAGSMANCTPTMTIIG
jgi:hypothetical protein